MVTLPVGAGFAREPAANDVQERLGAAVGALQQPLREAGSGPGIAPGGLPLGLVVPSVLPYRIGLRRADPAGTFRRDLVTIVSASPGRAAAVIEAGFEGTAGSVTLATPPGCPLGHPSCGIEAGMTVLLIDESGQADFYLVSAAVGNLVSLAGLGPVTGRLYRSGARLVPVEIATYYLRPSAGVEGPQLARYDGADSDLPAIDHFVDLSVEYFGDTQPPRLRAWPGPAGETMTYGPSPPLPGVDDERDSWGAGENCVIAVSDGTQIPRLPELGDARAPLAPLSAQSLADGPWCPDASAAARFDADLLRVRKVRIGLRAEAWSDSMRGRDPVRFLRPGTASGATRSVPDERTTFEVLLRAPGGMR
jgi:hypothetical protein